MIIKRALAVVDTRRLSVAIALSLLAHLCCLFLLGRLWIIPRPHPAHSSHIILVKALPPPRRQAPPPPPHKNPPPRPHPRPKEHLKTTLAPPSPHPDPKGLASADAGGSGSSNPMEALAPGEASPAPLPDPISMPFSSESPGPLPRPAAPAAPRAPLYTARHMRGPAYPFRRPNFRQPVMTSMRSTQPPASSRPITGGGGADNSTTGGLAQGGNTSAGAGRSAGSGTEGGGATAGAGDSGSTAGSTAGGGLYGGQAGAGGGGAPRHIVYLQDISQSMKPRFERAKNELRNHMRTLRSNESFTIIAFCKDVRPFVPELLPATYQNVTAADGFLSALRTADGTGTELAIRTALAVPGATIIVLITDGVPTYGQTNFRKLAGLIRDLNVNRVPIWTIGLLGPDPWGKDDTTEAGQLLQQIADDSGGQYQFVPHADTDTLP